MTEIQRRMEEARKAIGPDIATLVPFMLPPEPTQYHRTAPEIAYRAMSDALEGLEARELREVARLIKCWKECDKYRRRIIERVAVTASGEQMQQEKEREYAEWLDTMHPVIAFEHARKRLTVTN